MERGEALDNAGDVQLVRTLPLLVLVEGVLERENDDNTATSQTMTVATRSAFQFEVGFRGLIREFRAAASPAAAHGEAGFGPQPGR